MRAIDADKLLEIAKEWQWHDLEEIVKAQPTLTVEEIKNGENLRQEMSEL